MYPSISCLCPTYGRPGLLANAVACFLAQDYPKHRCCLVVLDDLGTISKINKGEWENRKSEFPGLQTHPAVFSLSTTRRYSSLPEKYNALWHFAPQSDIYVVWEDDDCQYPWCLSSHAKACEHHGWSYPSHVFSDYGDPSYPVAMRMHTEPTGGRFHGCLGIRGDTLASIGGWVETKAANFDQQLIGRLREKGQPGDPLQFSKRLDEVAVTHDHPQAHFRRTHPITFDLDNGYAGQVERGEMGLPAYVFRWHTGQTHGQSTMRAADDESWYDRYQPPERSGPHTIVPAFDADTRAFYDLLVS